MGGNVRVGLEDLPLDRAGKLAAANAEQVTKARRLLEELGLEIAAPRRGARYLEPQRRRPGRFLTG